MPSVEHTAIVEWVRKSPEVVPSLLTELGVPLPPFERVTVQESVLDLVAPTELRADLVLELGSADAPHLALFSERGFPLSSQHHTMLKECSDHVWLDRWLRRGLSATCPADVFD